MRLNPSSITAEKKRKKSLSDRGFSLIELLIVVAIILIIAAIAIPNFIQSKIRANEAATVANLRTITTANVIYSTAYSIGYASDLLPLSGSGAVNESNAQLIDAVLASKTKSGYSFSYAVLSTQSDGSISAYSINADPLALNLTGVRHFYADQSGVIRVNVGATAGPSDNPLQ